jgi:hypothetical protein
MAKVMMVTKVTMVRTMQTGLTRDDSGENRCSTLLADASERWRIMSVSVLMLFTDAK